MTLLSNLLLFSPGHSGFSSYVRRVMPALPGMRLLIDGARGPVCRPGDSLPEESPSGALALLARLSLTQHGVDVGKALAVAGLKPSEIEAVYSPFCDALFALPEVPQVITCHDLTPLHFPNSRRAAWRYRFWNPGHLRQARRLIAISRFVADQLIEIGLPGDRINVVPNGIGIVGRARSEPGGKDLLMLARHDGNKNVVHAVRGFGRFLARRPDWFGRLRVVGRRGRRTPELQRAIRDLGLTERVELLDAVDTAQLDHLMDRSLALISSSWMEGFDYPVLEAMAQGIPCLISDIPVHRELYRDAALLFDLQDSGEDLAESLEDLMRDQLLWSELSTLGIDKAYEFSLERQQQAILDVIDEFSSRG
jgi:glycosyltransferase involved in cell wall biosynthesis